MHFTRARRSSASVVLSAFLLLTGLLPLHDGPPHATAGQAGPFTFRSDGYALRALPIEQLPYYPPTETSLPGESDAEGVYMHRIGSALVDHPAGQAQRALKALGNYRLTGDPAMLEIAIANATRLLERSLVHDGGRFFPYSFNYANPERGYMTAPWYSALAQGQGLQAFVRLYEWTDDPAWLEAAHSAFASFLVAPADGAPWVTATENGLLWFDQYPTQPLDRVFNGHVFATFGIYDYWRVTADPLAYELAVGGMTTAAVSAERLRYPSGGPSHYCLSDTCLAHRIRNAAYHPVHIDQHVTLFRMTGVTRFAVVAELLTSDFPAPTGGGVARLAAGHHTGYAFSGTNYPVPVTTVSFGSVATAGYDLRQVPAWHSAPHNGIWLRLTDGPLAGLWVPESSRATPLGFVDQLHFDAPRLMRVAPGRYAGYKFAPDGSQTGVAEADLAGTLTYTRVATINGARSVLMADGPLIGRWLTLDLSVVRDFHDTTSSPFQTDIAWLASEGITRGCAIDRYCPADTVTREQMASFLARSLGLPPSSTDHFGDDDGSTHEPAINAVADAGITLGCASGRFCPRKEVTREQMASFLARALELPATSKDHFSDDASSGHQADINAIASAGISNGCGGGRYCPRQSVTREQMAAFLHRALA